MSKNHFIDLVDYSGKELKEIVALAEKMKKHPKEYRKDLKGKSLGMIFAKHSTRTRISFEVGIFQLGGQGLYFGGNDLQLSRGESIEDTAKVLSRYLDGIMIRTYSHDDVRELAKHATIPVINGLTDYSHPCQVMADLMTVKEHLGDWEGLKLAYVGDGNNMARSLIEGCCLFGMDISIVTPAEYGVGERFEQEAKILAQKHKVKVEFTQDIPSGVAGAHVVYTDTWTSMGQEKEREKRLKDFEGYQVNDRLMSYADRKAIFMHCLPCHREEEVSTSVIDGKQSVIFDEAENRLHVQKAIMHTLMS